jgi:hypothetical protein
MSESILREDGNTFYPLELPAREGKEGYVGTIFSLFLRFGAVMGEANFQSTDMRIEFMTHFMISLIPGRKNRAKVRDELKETLTQRLKEAQKNNNGEELNNEQKGRITNMTCLEIIGLIMDFTDLHVGVSSENRLGYVISPKGELVK